MRKKSVEVLECDQCGGVIYEGITIPINARLIHGGKEHPFVMPTPHANAELLLCVGCFAQLHPNFFKNMLEKNVHGGGAVKNRECEHANECPQICPCQKNCICRDGFCKEQ